MFLAPLPYLDPGSGSILLQVALAVLLAVGVVVRASWGTIKKWLGIKSKVADEEDDDTEDE